MALFDQIAAWIRGMRRRHDEEEKRTTATPAAHPTTEIIRRLQTEGGRRAEVGDCRDMYREDTRAKGVIQGVARDAVKGGFTVKVSGGAEPERAQEEADALIKRLRLFSRLDDWVRLTLRDGDTFLEVGVDEDRHIAVVTRKPTLEMHRASNRQDQFDDPARGYWWSDKVWAGARPPGDALWFADWQIIHARWDHDEGERYGCPLFGAARKPYKRMVEGEFDMALRRKTRAGLHRLHRFPDGTKRDVILEYQEINKDTLDNPFAAVADFFGTVDIKNLQGDARLAETGDVMHHIRTWWLASPMPMSLLGYGQDLNRDVLEKQGEQYERSLPTITQWVEDQIVRPLLELQWLLQGIWPPGLEYELIWASKRAVTPEDIRAVAEAVARLQGTHLIPDAHLLDVVALVLPDLEWETIRQALEAEEAEVETIASAGLEAL